MRASNTCELLYSLFGGTDIKEKLNAACIHISLRRLVVGKVMDIRLPASCCLHIHFKLTTESRTYNYLSITFWNIVCSGHVTKIHACDHVFSMKHKI